MRGWRYKTDPDGTPRRFLSHREAAWWALTRTGIFFVPFTAYVLVRAFADRMGDEAGAPAWSDLYVLAFFLAAWLAFAALLYLYVVLAGGVMNDHERRRYREERAARVVREDGERR